MVVLYSQGSTKIAPGIENIPGKMVCTRSAAMAPQPSFTIFVDEGIQENCQYEVELSNLEEMDANVKEQFNLLLEVSSGM